MARKHSSEAFYCLDDPLEAVVFSVLWEVETEREASRFDAGYYGKLMEKAWAEVTFVFTQDCSGENGLRMK